MNNNILDEVNQIKKQITYLSTQLQEFLLYLQQEVFRRFFLFCGFNKKTQSKQFMRAFKTMTQDQKVQYYCSCLRLARDLQKKGSVIQLQNQEIQTFQVLYRINQQKDWKKATIKFNYQQRMIQCKLFGQHIKIQKYIFRNSKCKERTAFVLQCYKVSAIQTLRLTAKNQITYHKLSTDIKNMADYGLKMMIQQKMGLKPLANSAIKRRLQSKQSLSVQIMNNKDKRPLKQLIHNSNLTLNLTQQKYTSISKNIINQQILLNLDNYSQYEQYTKNVYLNLNKNRVKKLFIFEEDKYNKNWIINQLRQYQNFKIWKMPLFMISLLADIPNQDSRIYHQIDMYKDRSQYDYVYLRHHFVRNQIDYFIDKSISTVQYGSDQTSNSRGKIDFCLWRIKKVGNIVEVLVQCEISRIDCLDIYDVINEHIGEFQQIKMCHMKQTKSQKTPSKLKYNFSLSSVSNNNIQFSEYQNGINLSKDQSQFYSIYSEQNLQDKKSNAEDIWQFQTIINDDSKSNFDYSPVHSLRKISSKRVGSQELIPTDRYQIKPTIHKINKLKQLKNGKFFDQSQCIVNKDGDLVFVNELKIKAQSSVLKTIVKKIGTNIFSGKSILNMSLPIQIFGNDTNLQRICKSNAFAPHFLENKINAQPIQRMKAVICSSLGNILLYIDMAKPFNPILGQTYQGFIDGCPLYGEQISHHPPISTIFMVGRGYFISANLEAKVNFGLNSVAGVNQGYYNIAFDNQDPSKNVIKYTTPPGQLSGTVYGQRKLSLIKQSFYFDQTNQVYCMIEWGKKKNKHELSYFNDYFEGTIRKLSKYQDNITNIKVNKDDEILGVINGRWTDKVYFNNELIVNLSDFRPYIVDDEEKLLLSDGQYRSDLQYFSQGKIEEAQKAKQQLQELQRNDRKLRKQYHK